MCGGRVPLSPLFDEPDFFFTQSKNLHLSGHIFLNKKPPIDSLSVKWYFPCHQFMQSSIALQIKYMVDIFNIFTWNYSVPRLTTIIWYYQSEKCCKRWTVNKTWIIYKYQSIDMSNIYSSFVPIILWYHLPKPQSNRSTHNVCWSKF